MEKSCADKKTIDESEHRTFIEYEPFFLLTLDQFLDLDQTEELILL